MYVQRFQAEEEYRSTFTFIDNISQVCFVKIKNWNDEAPMPALNRYRSFD